MEGRYTCEREAPAAVYTLLIYSIEHINMHIVLCYKCLFSPAMFRTSAECGREEVEGDSSIYIFIYMSVHIAVVACLTKTCGYRAMWYRLVARSCFQLMLHSMLAVAGRLVYCKAAWTVESKRQCTVAIVVKKYDQSSCSFHSLGFLKWLGGQQVVPLVFRTKVTTTTTSSTH